MPWAGRGRMLRCVPPLRTRSLNVPKSERERPSTRPFRFALFRCHWNEQRDCLACLNSRPRQLFCFIQVSNGSTLLISTSLLANCSAKATCGGLTTPTALASHYKSFWEIRHIYPIKISSPCQLTSSSYFFASCLLSAAALWFVICHKVIQKWFLQDLRIWRTRI